jgi:ADP-heptose:LPS heptosyltransferase
VIGLGPTANWEGKVWPGERFVALFRALAEGKMAGARVAVFAGPGEMERRLAVPVLAALPAAVDLVGNLSLPEAAACLARCALFVGNDSGLMHLAAAAGAPTLGLFGPSQVSEYAPSGRWTAVAAAPGRAGHAPIAGLALEVALAAAIGLLERAGEARAA